MPHGYDVKLSSLFSVFVPELFSNHEQLCMHYFLETLFQLGRTA